LRLFDRAVGHLELDTAYKTARHQGRAPVAILLGCLEREFSLADIGGGGSGGREGFVTDGKKAWCDQACQDLARRHPITFLDEDCFDHAWLAGANFSRAVGQQDSRCGHHIPDVANLSDGSQVGRIIRAGRLA
jgi:hypothetical protein